jgi:DHA1 family multidrug resistance protein-like MFS transporter
MERYNFSPKDVGLVILIVGIIGTIVQGVLVGRLINKFGEEKVLTGSLIVSAIGFILMTTAPSFAWVLITTSLFYLGNSILRPALNTFISNLAGNKQGMVMGLNNSFMSLGNAVGPILAGMLFEWNIHIPYFFGAFIMIVGLVSTRIWITRRKLSDIES